MGLVIVTPPDPSKAVLSITEAKDHVRVTDNEEDRLFQSLILAVTDWIAGPDGWLGRSLLPQTLELTVHAHWGMFDSPGRSGLYRGLWQDGSLWRVALPRPPLIAVQSVTSIDFDGTETILPSTAYLVEMGSDGLSHVRSTLNANDAFGRLRIRYSAGYPNDAVDEGIRLAMLMTVARIYENREGGSASDFRNDPLVQQFFAPYRVWSRQDDMR